MAFIEYDALKNSIINLTERLQISSIPKHEKDVIVPVIQNAWNKLMTTETMEDPNQIYTTIGEVDTLYRNAEKLYFTNLISLF